MPDEVTALTVMVEGGSLLLQALTPEETEAWTNLRLPPPWCLQLGLRGGKLWGVAAGQPVPTAPSPWKCPGCGRTMQVYAAPPVTCPSPDCKTVNPDYTVPGWWRCAWCHFQLDYPAPCPRCSVARPAESAWNAGKPKDDKAEKEE